MILKIILSGLLALSIGCSINERLTNIEGKIEVIETKQREIESNLDYLADRSNRLFIALEELSGKVRQNLASLSELDVSLDMRTPPRSVPENFLRQDQQLANSQGISLRAELFRFLNSITAGSFSETLMIAQRLGTRGLPDNVRQMVDFWEFFALVELRELKQALAKSQEFITSHQNSDRVPYIMFKQAGLFEALGDNRARNITLEKLVKDFPKSVEAQEAKKIIGRK